MRPSIAHGLVSFAAAGRAALPVAANLGALLGGERVGAAPAYVTWALTERCSMKCRHCGFGPGTPEAGQQGRAVIAERLARSGVWGVSLIGGEPSLVRDLGSLAAVLKAAGKYVSVGTSGFRLGRHLPALIAAGVDTVVFSLDHLRADVHDAFRGRPGLFDEASTYIAELRGLRGQRPRVQVRTTLHRENMSEIADIVDYWRSRADHVIVQVVQNNGIHEVRDPAVLFRPEDRPALEAAIAELVRRNPGLRSRYFDHMAEYVFEADALRERLDFRCMMVPAVSAAVTPEGDLRLCYGHEESGAGSLLEEDLETLWRSRATRQIRRVMQSRELECMCWEQVNSVNLDLLPWVHRVERVVGGGR